MKLQEAQIKSQTNNGKIMIISSFIKRKPYTLTIIGALLIVALGITLHYSQRYIQEKNMDRAVKSLKEIVNASFKVIRGVEMVTDAKVPLIEEHLDAPDMMFDFSRQLLEENPFIKGCSVSFEPNFFQEKGKFFSAYSYAGKDSLTTMQEGDENYNYFCMDWYLIPRQLNKKYWIEPYSEPDDNELGIEIMTSYCQPLHDTNGNIVGVLSTDMPLRLLSDTILSNHPFPESYCMLIGRGGTFIVHPDSTRLLYETILTPTLVNHDEQLKQLGRAMIGGETGSQTLMVKDTEMHVFYMPFGRTGWSLALVCPEAVLMADYNIFSWLIISLMALSAMIMLAPLWFWFRRRTNKKK